MDFDPLAAGSKEQKLPQGRSGADHAELWVFVRGQFLEGWPAVEMDSGTRIQPIRWTVAPRPRCGNLMASPDYKPDPAFAPFWDEPWTRYEFELELSRDAPGIAKITWHKRGDRPVAIDARPIGLEPYPPTPPETRP
jgi:hypothetical protein